MLCSSAERSSNKLTGEVNNIDDLITIKCSPENTLNLCGLVSTRPPINLIKHRWTSQNISDRLRTNGGCSTESTTHGHRTSGGVPWCWLWILASCGMEGGASIDQACSDTSDGCFNPTSKFPMRSSICWGSWNKSDSMEEPLWIAAGSDPSKSGHRTPEGVP